MNSHVFYVVFFGFYLFSLLFLFFLLRKFSFFRFSIFILLFGLIIGLNIIAKRSKIYRFFNFEIAAVKLIRNRDLISTTTKSCSSTTFTLNLKKDH